MNNNHQKHIQLKGSRIMYFSKKNSDGTEYLESQKILAANFDGENVSIEVLDNETGKVHKYQITTGDLITGFTPKISKLEEKNNN